MKALVPQLLIAAAIFLGATGPVRAADEPAKQSKEPKGPKGPVEVTVSCDREQYMHGQPGVRYIMAPVGKLVATLTIKNVSKTEQPLAFNSGQTNDFVIRNAKGEEVKRWSTGMMFTQALGDMKLQPGEEKTFRGDIQLGEVRHPLPHGEYTLEGILTSVPPISSAPVAFKIVPTPP